MFTALRVRPPAAPFKLQRAATSTDPSSEVADGIVDRTDGVPLFIDQVNPFDFA
jgi:hypothetical protein